MYTCSGVEIEHALGKRRTASHGAAGSRISAPVSRQEAGEGSAASQQRTAGSPASQANVNTVSGSIWI
jgi:hypothetical protein